MRQVSQFEVRLHQYCLQRGRADSKSSTLLSSVPGSIDLPTVFLKVADLQGGSTGKLPDMCVSAYSARKFPALLVYLGYFILTLFTLSCNNQLSNDNSTEVRFRAATDGPSDEAFQALLTSLAPGAHVIFDEAAEYRFEKGIHIDQPITVDLNGATLLTSGRILLGSTDGRTPGTSTGITLRNGILKHSKGVLMRNVEGGQLSDLIFTGRLKRTAINLTFCQNSTVNNVTLQTGPTDGSKIACLILYSTNCLVQNLQTRAGNWFVAGVQVKGGERNRVKDCLVQGVEGFRKCFMARGDAPWKPSRTSGLPYPYAAGTYIEPDERRATRETVFENCTVINSQPGKWNCFQAQESRNIKFINCQAINSGQRGFVVNRLVNGNEGNITIENCLVRFDNPVAGSVGIQVLGKEEDPIDRLEITDTKIEGCSTGLMIAHTVQPKLIGNAILQCAVGVEADKRTPFSLTENKVINCALKTRSLTGRQ